MSEQMWNQTTTEQYAKMKAQESALQHNRYERQKQAFLEETDRLLLSGTPEAHEALLELFSAEETVEQYGMNSNSVMEMIAAMNIYRLEKAAGESHTILDMCVDGQRLNRKILESHIRRFRFLFFRLEFTDETDREKNIIDFIKENRISPFFTCRAVDTMVVDRFNVLCELLDLFLENEMLRHAYWILRALKVLEPEEKSIDEMLGRFEEYALK